MKKAFGNLALTLLPGLIFAAIAAVGWYSYLSEQERNQAISTQSFAKQQVLEDKLSNQQGKINTLNDSIKLLEAEKSTLQNNLQIEVNQASSAATELKSELEQQQAEKESLRDKNNTLNDSMKLLEAEKSTLQNNLQLEVSQVSSAAAELKSELEQQQAEKESLHDKISEASEEKSKLLSRLEQEQINRVQVASLKSRLEKELNETRVEITLLKNQMTVIKLTNEVLFNSGSAEIKPAGKKVLSVIAESLNAYPDRAISVEGHTDDVPVIQHIRYESNWELSSARALAALNYFQQTNRVDPKRLKLVGYGEYHPVASNETSEGRKLNRRIEIRMLAPESANFVQN